jgi:alpha-L-rhamnosidase
MHRPNQISSRLGIFLTLLSLSLASMALQPDSLRCEYLVNPLGIEAPQPRLIWILSSEKRNESQSAYRILVASSEALLHADKGDLWDSGCVASDNSVSIVYKGTPLQSRARAYWKVRVWDQNGTASKWSPTAFWSMGLLDASDWSAAWIGYDAASPFEKAEDKLPEVTLEGASWIWYPEGAPAQAAPVEKCLFRREFTLPAGKAIQFAQLAVAADNRAKAYVNGKRIEENGGDITSFTDYRRFDLRELLRPGKNEIVLEAWNVGDGPNPGSLILKIAAILEDGSRVECVSDRNWHVTRGKEDNDLEKGLDAFSWKNALESVALGGAPWGDVKAPSARKTPPPPPYLRKEFAAEKTVQRATLYATALGLYEVEINDTRIGDAYFTPGWTDYSKRVYYQTYDVTEQVRSNANNAIGAVLADGWYAGHVGWGEIRERYGAEPRLRVQLELDYDDGSSERVVTDGSWKARYGDIQEADMLMGYRQDRQIVMDGWSSPGYDDAQWMPPVVQESVETLVQAHPGEPVRHFETIPARSMREHAPGVFVYDMGQNMVGWTRIKARGKAGDTVKVRFAEMLDADKSIYTTNLRQARATDYFTLRGDGVEVLEPKFTFHGFQYVEITGLENAPAAEDVEGMVVQSSIEQTGFFECSDPLVNQLFHNIVWGQKGNYLEVPTDCPQRDERLGWTGDAQFFMNTAAFTADVAAFFTKWLVDLVQDAQHENGAFAHIAPDLGIGGGAVAWGDAAMICTYQIYQYYGDTRVIEQHYDALVKGMGFLESTSKDYIRKDLGFGDWLNKGGGAKDEVICTAYYAYLSGLMAEMADAIGRDDKARYYADLREKIRTAFIENFLGDDGEILDSSQTGYALAFTMDLIPEALQPAAAKQFERELARFDYHLATGFIGTPRLLPALSQAGHQDLAYRLLMNKTYPSWLYQVTLGATTMWERWDGWTPEKGFQDPGMNSFNHYAFGAVGEWIYTTVGGIQSLSPGFKRIRVAPKPGGGLSWANTTYHSIRGAIVSEWKLKDKEFQLHVVIPPNTTAEVHLPHAQGTAILESRQPAEQAEGVQTMTMGADTAIIELGSGEYAFQSNMP